MRELYVYFMEVILLDWTPKGHSVKRLDSNSAIMFVRVISTAHLQQNQTHILFTVSIN